MVVKAAVTITRLYAERIKRDSIGTRKARTRKLIIIINQNHHHHIHLRAAVVEADS